MGPSITTQSPDSDTVTDGIRIRAAAQYLPEESMPEAPLFLFRYRIVMTNEGDRTVKLLSRHWIIKDAFNEREDVRGAGVVGEYPTLGPGDEYQYQSTCPLRTRWGTMEGSYTFEDLTDSSTLDAAIGRFFLVPSSTLNASASGG